MVDAHCHLQDKRLQGHLGDVLRRAKAANVTHIASCACFEADWRALEQLLSSFSNESGIQGGHQDVEKEDEDGSSSSGVRVLPSFGLHPWWASSKSPEYLARLRSHLEAFPNAMLGEIGLCKSTRGKQIDMGTQEQVFREQLALAAELQRGCVVHCVGAHGKLLEILQHHRKTDALPPTVILHSYSGPAEMVAAFLALERKPSHDHADFKVYFSLNAKQLAIAVKNAETITISDASSHSMKPTKSEAACAKIPRDALLLETDAPDQAPLGNPFYSELIDDHGLNEPAQVQLALQGAATVCQMPVEELAIIVYENASRVFGLSKDERK